MRLRKIELANFGPYRGKHSIEFSDDEEKNICIIWGTNGAGKTHILQAIKWALYGWDVTPRSLLRNPTSKDAWRFIHGSHTFDIETRQGGKIPDPHMYVYLWLEEGSNRYLVKRRVRPLNPSPKSSAQIDVDFDVDIDSRSASGRGSMSPKEAIEVILPPAASQFFMFHGEEIREISQKHLEETKKAIELILEAETFRVGRADLQTVAREIDKELDGERAKSEDLRELLKEKLDMENNIDERRKERLETSTKLKDAKDRLDSLETQLRNYKTTERLMGKLDLLRTQKNQLVDERKKVLERRSEILIQLPLKMILPELRKIMAKKETAHERIELQRQEWQELKGSLEFAQKLTKMAKCVCGRAIGRVEAEYINDHLKHASAEVGKAHDSIEREDPSYYEVRETIARIDSSSADFERYQRDLDQKSTQLDEIDTQVKNIEKNLSDVDEKKVSDLTAQRNAINQEIGRLEEKEDELELKTTRLEQALERIVMNIKRREGGSAIRTALENQLSISMKASEAFDDVLSRLVEVRRTAIEKYASGLFTELTNKPDEYDKIAIDEGYNVSVIDKHGNSVARETLSTGEREVVALSFIFGLMKASEKTAPLVLDTFFVHLDEAHYSNIVRTMPSFADQIILILTNLEYKNLRDRAKPEFWDHVSQVYQVVRNTKAEESSLILETGVTIEA